MSGDYSRNTFKARKNFSGVLMQQGRVQLDADWNEQVEIDDRRWRTETVDIIGRAVAPKETQDAFKIELSSGGLSIHPGRMYVDGLLAENHGKEPTTFNTVLDEERGTQPVPYNEQPYLPELPDLPTNGTHMVFLDVWRREVTHLKDPDMVEPAVGVDTTTRMQTVWQVKVLELDGAGNLDCDDEPDEWKALIEPSAGRLSTSTIQAPSDPNPCLIPSTGGYRGLENRLYRVEVHEGGKLGDARFKWARHNASVETLVTSINGAKLTLARSQWDGYRRFNIGDRVEVTDDVHELAGQAGEMRQIDDVNHATKTITLNSALPSIDFPTSGAEHLTDPNRHTRIRRWHQNQGVDAEGLLEVTGPPVEIDIEDGIRIAFSIDPARPNPEFKVGDFWHFYARTTDASVEILNDAPPRGIHHHYAKLAVVTFPGTVIDCRNHWPPQISTQGCCTVTVGDGTVSHGDYDSVQAAIDSLPGAGGRVCLLPGEYRENVRITGRSNVTLAGCGKRSNLVSLDPTDDSQEVHPVIHIENSSGIRVESISAEAHKDGIGILVEETPRDSDGSAALPVKDILLSDLYLKAAMHCAIEIQAGSHITICGCHVAMQDVKSEWPGVFLICEDVLIEKNVIMVVPSPDSTPATAVASTRPVTAALGGLQIGGTSERVRIIENLIQDGLGNGITLGSLEVEEVDAAGNVITRTRPWPRQPEDPCDPCAPPSLRIPPLANGDEGEDEPTYRSAGSLYDILIENNRIYKVGLNGIGVAGFFVLDAADEFISVDRLTIRGNDIRGCLNRPLTEIDDAMVDSMAYGGIALADVSDLVIHHNAIEDNGPDHLQPVCGIFVLHAEGADITDNNIVNNGAKTAQGVANARDGRRGGINIVFAVAPTVPTPIGRPAAAMVAVPTLTYPRQNGVPAIKIHGNVVSQPLGRALSVAALGPVSVVDNQLTSRGVMLSTAQPSPTIVGATVMIVNLGISNELHGQLTNFSGIVEEQVKIVRAAPTVAENILVLPREGLDDLQVGRYLANGNVLFSDNQCVLDLLESGFGRAASSITIFSLDDIGFHNNQCDCSLFDDFVHTHACVLGFSVRVADNRFKEGVPNAAFSACTAGAMNTTTNNQCTHCLLVFATLPGLKVDTGNKVLLEGLAEGYCNKTRIALRSTDFSLRRRL